MARRCHQAIAVLICAILGCGAAPPGSGSTQDRRGPDTSDEPAPDAGLLADLEILRDLDLLRNLEILRKVGEARSTPRRQMPREEKAKP